MQYTLSKQNTEDRLASCSTQAAPWRPQKPCGLACCYGNLPLLEKTREVLLLDLRIKVSRLKLHERKQSEGPEGLANEKTAPAPCAAGETEGCCGPSAGGWDPSVGRHSPFAGISLGKQLCLALPKAWPCAYRGSPSLVSCHLHW